MAEKTRAQSSTVRAIGPTLSMLHDKVIHPNRLTRPKVGRSPLQPQVRQGETMLPWVSLPRPKPTRPAVTDEAAPAEEPLEPVRGFQGLRVMPPNQRSPMARAPRVSLA